MPAERYFHSERFLDQQTIILEDQEFHHLVHVMRTRAGDTVEVVNGQGQLAQVVVESIEKKRAYLSITSLQTEPPSDKKIILAQGIPRLPRLEFILEKCTELGVTEIWLFPAMRSEKRDFSDNQLERMKTLTISAMKQCGRLYLPTIILMPSLKLWDEKITMPIFFGDTDPSAPTFNAVLQKLGSFKEAIFCIGPESGFTNEEIAVLKQRGAFATKLHPNILRTDTAAIAAIALLSHRMMLE